MMLVFTADHLRNPLYICDQILLAIYAEKEKDNCIVLLSSSLPWVPLGLAVLVNLGLL